MKETKVLVQQEIYKSIAHFIKRQGLVAQAMHDLGLDLEEVGKYGAIAWASSAGKDKTPNFNLDENASDETREMFDVARRAEARQVSQVGSWGETGEWEYFLHGKGCRLRNVHTGEVIDWDCPNVLAFDPHFFLYHLEWQLETGFREDELRHTQQWIQQHPKGLKSVITLIQEMIDNGLINPDLTLPEGNPMKDASKPIGNS
jgi:hypothetical protein